MMHLSRQRCPGFTLVEIMIAVGLILLLATLAIPAFMRARRNSQNSVFISDVRVAAHAFSQCSLERGGFPADADPGMMPDGMDDYLSNMHWTEGTPLGGQWDWAPDVAGIGSGVRVVGSLVDDTRMTEVDTVLDDGNLGTGMFRKLSGADGYLYRVE